MMDDIQYLRVTKILPNVFFIESHFKLEVKSSFYFPVSYIKGDSEIFDVIFQCE